jgi:hypothetical protein
MPLAKATNLESVTQSNKTCLSSEQVKSLAVYKKDCDVVKLNFEDTKVRLKECTEATCGNSFWQEPSFIIGGMAVTFAAGLLVGSAIIGRK